MTTSARQTVPTSPPKQLVQVKGAYVPYDVDTWGRISCEAFDHEFSDATPIHITDTATLQAIEERLTQLKPYKPGYGVDVRAKVVLFYTNKSQDTLCMNEGLLHYQGHNMYPDSVFYHLLGFKTGPTKI